MSRGEGHGPRTLLLQLMDYESCYSASSVVRALYRQQLKRVRAFSRECILRRDYVMPLARTSASHG
jgi:hypothetical protein